MPPTSTSPNTPSTQRDHFVLTGTSGGMRRWRGQLVAVVTVTGSHLPQPAASPRYRICCRSRRKIPRLNAVPTENSVRINQHLWHPIADLVDALSYWQARRSLSTGSLCLVQSSSASKCREFLSRKNPV